MITYHPTRFEATDGQKLYFGNFGRAHWQFVSYDPSMPTGLKFAPVGPIYKTKTELLCDADRYAHEFGF